MLNYTLPDYFALDADRGKIGKQDEEEVVECPICGASPYDEEEVCEICNNDFRSLKK